MNSSVSGEQSRWPLSFDAVHVCACDLQFGSESGKLSHPLFELRSSSFLCLLLGDILFMERRLWDDRPSRIVLLER